MLSVVVAASKEWGIGKDGGIPWRLPGDMAYFREVTMATTDPDKQNAVVMGRRTWDSIPAKFRPLKGRTNIVLTRTPASEWCATLPPQLPPQQPPQQPPLPLPPPPPRPPSPAQLRARSLGRRAESLPDEVHVATSLDGALGLVKTLPGLKKAIETLFVIGGAQVYAEALQHPQTASLHLTRVDTEVDCDTFIPDMTAHGGFALATSSAVQEENGIKYRFQKYDAVSTPPGDGSKTPQKASKSTVSESPPDCSVTEPGAEPAAAGPAATMPAAEPAHEELQYLEMVKEIIEHGVVREDRTGVGTKALFGKQMRFNLRETFPLLTTKRVFWRGVAEELLWFIKGCTDGRELSEKGIKIWDGNGSREYLDKIGLTEREEGDLGPVYGFQWRHFGAKYIDRDADYTGQGFDQLADVIDKIKNKPNDRRIIMSAWNPAALSEMALRTRPQPQPLIQILSRR
jgi:dihydrofolate reductase/thymidylate synthase